MNAFALYTGYATMVVGALLLGGLLLWLAVEILDHFGGKLWKKLCAYHDIRLLRTTLQQLEAQGKTMGKEEQP